MIYHHYVHFSDPFPILDKDKDGFVSKSEIEAAGFIWYGRTGVLLYDINGTYMMLCVI